MAELGFHIPSLVVYLVNFTILLVILYLVGYKRILRVLDERSQRIKESMEQAQTCRWSPPSASRRWRSRSGRRAGRGKA